MRPDARDQVQVPGRAITRWRSGRTSPSTLERRGSRTGTGLPSVPWQGAAFSASSPSAKRRVFAGQILGLRWSIVPRQHSDACVTTNNKETQSLYLVTQKGDFKEKINRSFLGGVGFLTTLGVGVGFFCPTLIAQLDPFSHQTPKLGILLKCYNFFLKLLLKQRILAVYHDFHWLLVATKMLTAKFHSLYVKSRSRKFWKLSELESDILPPTPQPC